MENLEENGQEQFQVIVCNIHWSTSSSSYKNKNSVKTELPDQTTMTIPESVLNQANKTKSQTAFNDIIEQFIYNLLTRKFNCEVANCQIWLPLEK